MIWPKSQRWWWWFSPSVWLRDPMDCSPPGSSVYVMFQARILEWVAISFSRGTSWPRDWIWVSCIAASLLHCRLILSWLSQHGSHLPANAGDAGSIPGRGTQIPRASEQLTCVSQLLSPWATRRSHAAKIKKQNKQKQIRGLAVLLFLREWRYRGE